MSSDDDLGTFVDPDNVKSTNTYESNLIDEFQQKESTGKIEKSIADSEAKIDKIKSQLANATLNGKEALIEKYKKQLEEETDKLEELQNLPKDFHVDLDLSSTNQENDDSKLPEQNDELMKFWHYKVMHTSFSGQDSINLTIDDSDKNVYKSRNAFIHDHCAPYTEITQIDERLAIPTAIWNSLYPHQKAAIQWLWEKWNDKHGGIEGDEMGLGKTAITCTFLHALHFSNFLKGPVLILCPLTVNQQWIRELHIWAPQLRSILLHSTRSNRQVSEESLLERIDLYPSVIVTNYETLRKESIGDLMEGIEWSAVICDEGHKIRNHETIVSVLVKRLKSEFHLAISGTPIQNSLVELWSIFDFAVPNLLGSYECFNREFAEPIKRGGYSNANPMEVLKAYKLAVALRDLISPYILRRLKKDVNVQLPMKSEQILFLNLTPTQIQAYQNFLNSSLYKRILSGKCQLFVGIDFVRKICNHPCLAEPKLYKETPELSCKLNLLMKILPQWKRQNHRVLIFSQYLRMLDLIGILCIKLKLTFFRLDGRTPNLHRTEYMDRYNAGEKFAVIASTKVGGIGVNLTGADRVIIVDPDWNPSNDIQALQRAWRIGQKRDVAVYRLISVGTIEEKMYKKQIIKSFLSEKILSDPNQKRMFSPDTLKDLFKLDMEIETEFLIEAKSHDNQQETPKDDVSDENEDATYKYMSNSEDASDDESTVDRFSTDGLSDDDQDDGHLLPNESDSDTLDLSSSSDDDNDDEDDEITMPTSEVTELSIELDSDDEMLDGIESIRNREENKDQSAENTNTEKEMLEHLLTDGNLKHAFSIEQLFSGKTDNPKLLQSQNSMQKSVDKALEKLKWSTQNHELQDDEICLPKSSRRLRNILLDLFRKNQKVLTSKDIVVFFNNYKEVFDAKQIRKNLRAMATLNPTNHIWKLNEEYAERFVNYTEIDEENHKSLNHDSNQHSVTFSDRVVQPLVNPSLQESRSRPFKSLAGISYTDNSNQITVVSKKVEYIKPKAANEYIDKLAENRAKEKAKKFQLFPDAKPRKEAEMPSKINQAPPAYARIERTKNNAIFNELVDLFNRHHGALATEKITSYFNALNLPKNPELLKSTLKIVAVLNKRTHIWHLKDAYKMSIQ